MINLWKAHQMDSDQLFVIHGAHCESVTSVSRQKINSSVLSLTNFLIHTHTIFNGEIDKITINKFCWNYQSIECQDVLWLLDLIQPTTCRANLC